MTYKYERLLTRSGQGQLAAADSDCVLLDFMRYVTMLESHQGSWTESAFCPYMEMQSRKSCRGPCLLNGSVNNVCGKQPVQQARVLFVGQKTPSEVIAWPNSAGGFVK